MRRKVKKMVDMQLSNNKLIDCSNRLIISELKIDQNTAAQLLEKFGSVRKAVESTRNNLTT